MSEEKMQADAIQGLVNKNLKVRVVLDQHGPSQKFISQQGDNKLSDNNVDQTHDYKHDHKHDQKDARDQMTASNQAGNKNTITNRSSVGQAQSLPLGAAHAGEQYTYHYGRIFFALAIIASLMIALIYIVWTNIAQEQQDKPVQIELSQKESAVPVEAGLETQVDLAETEVESGSVMEQLVSELALNESPEKMTEEPEEPAIAVLPEKISQENVNNEKNIEEISIEKSGIEKKVVEENEEKIDQRQVTIEKQVTTEKTVEEKTVEEKSVEEVEKTVDQAKLAADNIRSAKVLHAQLSDEIKNRRAQESLKAAYSLGDQKLIKIYLETVVKDLAGQPLHYRWYQNNKLMADVPITARTNEYRSYSSKNINQEMLGDWTVKVETHRGALLVESDFTVLP